MIRPGSAEGIGGPPDAGGLLPYSGTRAWMAQGLLRAVAGYCFLLHGTAKLLKIPHVPMFDQLELFSLMGLAGVLELVGGLLLLIGLFTRPVAFVLAGQMAVAYFMGHAIPKGNFGLPLLNGGEPAVLFCFIFLFLAAAGSGAFSIDAMRAGSGKPKMPR